jgi:hypothetical protein
MILDKFLASMKAKGSRILVFSQMSRVLEIIVCSGNIVCPISFLAASLLHPLIEYCRIDGGTAHDDCILVVDEYNKLGARAVQEGFVDIRPSIHLARGLRERPLDSILKLLSPIQTLRLLTAIYLFIVRLSTAFSLMTPLILVRPRVHCVLGDYPVCLWHVRCLALFNSSNELI